MSEAPRWLDLKALNDEQVESLYHIERAAMRHALETFAAMQRMTESVQGPERPELSNEAKVHLAADYANGVRVWTPLEVWMRQSIPIRIPKNPLDRPLPKDISWT